MIQWGFLPTRLQWAASCFRDDPAFAAQAYRMTQACPSDPRTAQLALELAACWASDDPDTRASVPGLPALPLRAPIIPDDVLDHWLDWQRHLGRYAGSVLEQDGIVIIHGGPTPFLYCDHHARPSPLFSLLGAGAMLQVPSTMRALSSLAQSTLDKVVEQTVAVMPAIQAARLPRELPEGFSVRPVETAADVDQYRDVTRQAYAASYGPEAQVVGQLVTSGALLGQSNVRAWIVSEGETPVRVITGFVARGIVGAHAGAAVPSIRGRHFSEPLLSLVSAWGYALGANVLAGVCMPQAVPILTRIGATVVCTYTTYRRSA